MTCFYGLYPLVWGKNPMYTLDPSSILITVTLLMGGMLGVVVVCFILLQTDVTFRGSHLLPDIATPRYTSYR